MGEPQISEFEQVTRERADIATNEIKNINSTMDKVWHALGDIRQDLNKRLPAWVTWVISAQMAMIGSMAMWILERVK